MQPGQESPVDGLLAKLFQKGVFIDSQWFLFFKL